MVKSVKLITFKGPQGSPDLTTKICQGGRDLTTFKNLPGGCPGEMVKLEIDRYMTPTKFESTA